jgi:DNA-directed RNA polymerase specialized sigma24 family protein
MNKEWTLTQESFDALLTWLDQDRDRAGQKYEEVRRRLIKIFTCRGCREAEDLTDETINRVTLKLNEIKDSYTGERALYFYGVANKVFLEYLRKKPVPVPPSPAPEPEDSEPQYECLEQCIKQLTPSNRELVLRYYREEKRAKIENRWQLADHLGIALNALRIRAHRIRTTLQKCVQDCLAQQSPG